MVVPGLVVLLLLALPFLDRRPERSPRKRPVVAGAFAALGAAIVVLTWLGLADSPAQADPDDWGPVAVAGREIARDGACLRCHVIGGPANVLESTRLRRDPEWLVSHVQDPEIIAPGLREPPPDGMNALSGAAVLAYMQKLRAGSRGPDVERAAALASRVFATRCASCHALDGDGDPSAGGDLSRIGREHDERWLREWISDPASIDELAEMPAFGERLSAEEMNAIVRHLAARR
jgi:mono/diheme cytochrome c family protein